MIQTIKYNGKILNVKPSAGTVQGRYSFIFKRLVTDRQHTCNSVDKWVSIPASSVTSLYPQLTKFLSLSSLAFYRTLLAPLSFANSDLRYVFFYSKCNSEEPRQNSITTWNSYSWYLRKIIRNILNINSLSFPFFAFHNFFIFIFNFSVLRLLQSYLRLLVTSFLRDLSTPWLSGWRIWPKTVLKSVLGKWKFLMDFIREHIFE